MLQYFKNPKRMHSKNQSGFTLIELILYAGLVAIMTSAISALLVLALDSRAKHQVIELVESSGIIVMDDMLSSIRNADSVVLAAEGGVTTITVTTFNADTSPTVYTFTSGDGTITKTVDDAGEPQELFSDALQVVEFEAVTYSDEAETQKIVDIELLLQFRSTDTRAVYNYSRRFTGSSVIRTP